jgi:hypothetical protein
MCLLRAGEPHHLPMKGCPYEEANVYSIKVCWHAPVGLRTGGETSKHSSRIESFAARGLAARPAARYCGDSVDKANVGRQSVISIKNSKPECSDPLRMATRSPDFLLFSLAAPPLRSTSIASRICSCSVIETHAILIAHQQRRETEKKAAHSVVKGIVREIQVALQCLERQ